MLVQCPHIFIQASPEIFNVQRTMFNTRGWLKIDIVC